MNQTTKSYIENLAKENNIKYKERKIDKFANKITDLSGDEIVPDDTMNLIIELKRSGIITKKEVVDLASKYLKERKKLNE